MLLTARFIELLKAEAEPYRWREPRPSILALRVAPNGVKSFDVAYRIKGSPAVKRTTIGRYGDVNIDEARGRAFDLVKAARKGKDLIADEEADREAKARAMTLRKLVDLYIARRVTGRLRSAPAVARILQGVLEPVFAKPADDVHRRDLAPLFEEIAARGRQGLAGLSLTLIGTMFRWALSQGLVSNDPTKGLSDYDTGTPRDRVLDARRDLFAMALDG